jgi:hypothetical protein
MRLAGCGYGLIGSFAAGVHLEIGAEDGFAGCGDVGGGATRSMLMLPTTTIGLEDVCIHELAGWLAS